MASDANPKQAYGDLKVALQLVPPALVIHAAKALKEGAGKYGPYNWRKTKVEALTYVGAILRHLAAYQDGEDLDPESATGKSHLDGVAASLAILLDAQDGGTLIDNRPPAGPAPRLVLTPKAPVKQEGAEVKPARRVRATVDYTPCGSTLCNVCYEDAPKETA